MQTRWRHPSARSSTRSFSLLPLALALAALVIFPIGARAEASNEKVYKVPIPKVEGTTPEKGGDSAVPPKTSPKSHSIPGESGDSTATGERTPTEPEAEGEPEAGHTQGTTPGGKGGDHHDGGKPQGGASPNEGQRSQSDGTGPSEPGTGVDTGGGSSPVVPILIAIGILAAVSIGVVVYRERGRAGDPDSYSPGSG
jgi:hypothetical protein